jgi:hypothetical protein
LSYSSATDALKHVLLEGGRVTKSPAEIKYYPDGPYYFVEVTSREGVVYILNGFGSEAFDLKRTVNTGSLN